MAANGMTPCQPRKKARTTIQAADLPGRPDRLRRNVTADAPAVTWAGDITLHPGPGKGGSPHLATVTGLHLAKRITGHTRGRSHAVPG